MDTRSDPDRILEHMRKHLETSVNVVDVEERHAKAVVFTLGGDYFAFFDAPVKEILPMLDIYPVPGSPALVLGVVNIRGDVESVLDLHGLLGMPPYQPTAHGRIIMADAQGIRTGMLVDSVEDLLDLPESAIEAPLGTLTEPLRQFVSGSFLHEGINVAVLDLQRLISRATAAATGAQHG